MLLYPGNERFTVAINPCIMYFRLFCSFLGCVIVLPLVVLHGLSMWRSIFHPV